jgi:23S rRNA pseudouridine1911/1915/1917 synthase
MTLTMILVAEDHERLDKFLARNLEGYSRTKLAAWIDSGHVFVDGILGKPALKLEPGMEVELELPEPTAPHDLAPADIPLDVIFEDDSLLVVNKQRGLATHPATSLQEPSLVNALLFRGGALSEGSAAYRPGIVHRLDKDTTGLLVVAKTDSAHSKLSDQISAKTAERRYVAVAAGLPELERFDIDAPIGRDPKNRARMAVNTLSGRRALTRIRLVRRLDQGCLLAVRLETGRTHQIRVHLAAVNHPVLGDSLYAPPEISSGPLQLHAAGLSFDHPVTGERLSFFAPPPLDFLDQCLAAEDLLTL